MSNTLRRRIFLGGVAGALSGCTSGQPHRLNVYNWDNYVARDTIPEFERRFGCRVRYAVYSSAEEMLAKIMSGNSGWDVIFPPNNFIVPLRELGLLARLDHQKLPALPYLDPEFRTPPWDPLLTWCVPYMHSATGILYAKQASPPPQRWAELWTPSYRGRQTMLDDPAEVFAACLKRLGFSVNATSESQLKAARDLAIQQKPLLRAYLNEEVRDQVVAGDVLAAQMWAQVAQVAMDNSPDLAFAFPQEGFPLYADNTCILRESKHQELAYEWLNYLLEPAVAARIATEITAATANAAARTLLSPKLRNNPVLYLTEETRQRGEWFQALPPTAQRLRDRYWTEIKAA